MRRQVMVIVGLALFGGALEGCSREGDAPSPAATTDPSERAGASGGLDADAVDTNNRGVGLMGQFRYADACEAFEQVHRRFPEAHSVTINLAIATLNRQQPGDEQRALELLEGVLEAEPSHVRALYCKGLLLMNQGRPAEAGDLFARVAAADPDDAYAAYYLGQCRFQERDFETALAQYEQALAGDPYLRSAYYAAFQSLQRLGRADDARTMLDEFERLKTNPRARTVAIAYTKMGPKAETVAVGTPEVAEVALPAGPLFADPSALLDVGVAYQWAEAPADRPVSVTACDIDGDNAVDVVLWNALQHRDLFNAVLMNRGDGTFRLDEDSVLARVMDVNAALWGDYDNDGLVDVYLCRRGRNQLWRQAEPGRWDDVTETTGTANGDFDTLNGAIFDADHDGDLDLFCVNADGPNELLNNNLDGTFRPLAAERGLAGEAASHALQVLPVDLDADRDLDLIVVNRDGPHEVYLNDRLWSYRPADGFDAFRTASDVVAVVATDVDVDGQVELYAYHARHAVSAWSVDVDGVWTTGPIIDRAAGGPSRGQPLAIADVTGAGSPCLLSPTPSGWEVQDLAGASRGAVLFSAEQDVAGWGTIVLDERGPAVVAARHSGAPEIWSPGSGRLPSVLVTFTGKEDTANSMRSNASGIGTHFAARLGARWSAGATIGTSAGPGQSLQPVTIGLGGGDRIDFVAIDWPDGVFQSELDLSSGRRHRIAETQRQLSSCPVLFAWDGDSYRFISDVLGVGGMGYLVAPGEYAPPRPWEHFLFPPESLAPREGRLAVKLAEPMEEACYLDAVRLVAYRLPPGWQMTLDERMGIGSPEPTGAPRFYRREVRPIRALDASGTDVSSAIAEADHVAVPVGTLDHRFLGRLRDEHVVTLEFAEPIDAGPGRPILIAHGWVEYPYSQTMFAAWQAGADYRAPTIEARADDGEWTTILPTFGYPAGMPREMSVPLTGLPSGARHLRISTNQEIYWDRLAVAYAEPCDQVTIEVCRLESSMLSRVGFPHRTTAEQRLPGYQYDRRVPFWDARYQSGFYTRFGPVDPLVSSADGQCAIFGAGEEVHLEFAAPAVTSGPGSTRYVLELNGWCKDMDLFTASGETLGPLPTASNELGERFNSRFESGRQ